MATGSLANPPWVAHRGDETFKRSEHVDEDDYPFGLPSFSPSITDVKGTQSILNNREYFGETRCDIIEASALNCRWNRHVDDEGLNRYLLDKPNETLDLAFRAL